MNLSRMGIRIIGLTNAVLLHLCLCNLQFVNAQICKEQDVEIESALQDSLNGCSTRRIIDVAIVAGAKAIPELKKMMLDDHPCRNLGVLAKPILAKLGDKDVLNEYSKQSIYAEGIKRISDELVYIGNERALKMLVKFLANNESNGPIIIKIGDLHADAKAVIRDAILRISKKINVPDLDALMTDPVRWHKRHGKDKIILPIDQGIADSYLRCLFNAVDFGYPDNVQEIVRYKGNDVESLLRMYPRVSYTGWAANSNSLEGNLQVAFAKMGDIGEYNQLINEVSGFNWEAAIEKLGRISDKARLKGYGIRLGIKQDQLRNVEKLYDSASGVLKDSWRRVLEEERDKYYKSQKSLLDKILEIVANPPVYLNANSADENIQNWKEWLDKNLDSVQIRKSTTNNME